MTDREYQRLMLTIGLAVLVVRCASFPRPEPIPLPINNEAPRITPKPRKVQAPQPERNEPYRLVAQYEGRDCADKVLLDWDSEAEATETINIATWNRASARPGWQVESCGRLVVMPHWFLRPGPRIVRAYFFKQGRLIGHVVRKVEVR